jgi:O-antigen ligase
VKTILKFQPLFAVPVYFSVLVNTPPLWLSLIIAIIPLGLRFWLTRHFIQRTPFDVPILIFILGTLVGVAVAPNKEVALGALSSTLASILIYYGIVSNSEAGNKYWLWMAGTICVITLLMSIWFFSQGNGRQFFFNQWAFKLFEGLPRTSLSLQMHSLGALLSVILPPLFAITLFRNNTHLRLGALVLGVIFLVVLFLSASGGGWIAVICGLAFVLICWRLWMIGVVVPAMGLITSAAVVFYNNALWLAQSFSINSVSGRVGLWVKTIPLFTGYHIIAGLGLGGWFELYYRLYGTSEGHTHNSYLQLYTDTGIVGVLALITAVVVFVRLSVNILQASKQNPWYGVAVGFMGAIVAGAVFGCFDVTTTGTVVTATSYIYLSIPLLWVWSALFVVAHKHLNSQK